LSFACRLLVIEGLCASAAAVIYIWHLLQQVVMQRYALFTVFLVIPTSILRSLASKRVSVCVLNIFNILNPVYSLSILRSLDSIRTSVC